MKAFLKPAFLNNTINCILKHTSYKVQCDQKQTVTSIKVIIATKVSLLQKLLRQLDNDAVD